MAKCLYEEYLCLIVSYPRIDKSVAQVGDKVDGDHQACVESHDRGDGYIIPILHRSNDQAAQSGTIENDLGQDRRADEDAGIQP